MAKKAKIAPRRSRPAANPAPKPKPFDLFKTFDCVRHVDQQTYPGVGVVIGAMLTDLAGEPMICVRYRDGAFYWVPPSVLTYA